MIQQVCVIVKREEGEMHKVVRAHAMAAWQKVWAGEPNPLADRPAIDPEVL